VSLIFDFYGLLLNHVCRFNNDARPKCVFMWLILLIFLPVVCRRAIVKTAKAKAVEAATKYNFFNFFL